MPEPYSPPEQSAVEAAGAEFGPHAEQQVVLRRTSALGAPAAHAGVALVELSVK